MAKALELSAETLTALRLFPGPGITHPAVQPQPREGKSIAKMNPANPCKFAGQVRT